MAIRWLFFRDKAGQCRWEVRGAEGPIATSGNVFESAADCVADARARGFDGPEEPTVASDPVGGSPDVRSPKHAARQ